MGVLNQLSEASFEKSERGEYIFIPFGALGSKFIVQEKKKLDIKKFLKTFYPIAFLIVILCLFKFLYGLLGLALLSLFYIITMKRLLIGAFKITNKNSMQDLLSRISNSFGFQGIMTFVMINLLMVLIFSLIVYKNQPWLGISGTIGFGILLIFSYMLLKKLIENKD